MLNWIPVALFIFYVVLFHSRRRKDGVAALSGPSYISWVHGNLANLVFSQRYGDYEFDWQKKYGRAYRVRGCVGENRLMVADPVGLKSIFQNPDVFIPVPMQRTGSWILGGPHSIFYVFEHDHKRIRNVFNTAFTPSRLRALVPSMQTVSRKVAEYWESLCSESTGAQAVGVVDIYKTLQQLTLETVGECIMGYQFNGIGNDDHPVARNLFNILTLTAYKSRDDLVVSRIVSLLPEVALQYLLLNSSNEASRALFRFKNIMAPFSNELVANKIKNQELGLESSDLLSIVVSENQKLHPPAKLIDPEIASQVAAILIAGQDTTGNTLAWAFYELARHPQWQDKIREEIVESRSRVGELTYAELEAMPCLNAYLKEILRFYPGVPYDERIAATDTVLPLSKPVRDVDGQEVSEIVVLKGQMILCGLASYNRNEEIWGDDADTFDPSRWLKDGSATKMKSAGLGPYANLSTFFGGSHACIGLLEMQVIIAELLLKFRFDLVEGVEIRPIVRNTLLPATMKDDHPQVPLKLTLIE
ncbi:cytochrome p450 [Moniliophthora roreri]|nr:cytochrome p450 [Moniliophthora roreri]